MIQCIKLKVEYLFKKYHINIFILKNDEIGLDNAKKSCEQTKTT